MTQLAVALAVGVSVVACAGPRGAGKPDDADVVPAPDYQALVAASDRAPADREADAGRKPAEMLAFIGVRPGARVAELGAGTGYTAELLARAVGPRGTVFAQNPPMLLQRFETVAQAWTERLTKPIMQNTTRVDAAFEDPLPPEATLLDAVVMNLFYHDLYWLGTFRTAMNRRILSALKPGGVFVVIDHSAKPGAGVTGVQSLHRIEEDIVRADIEAAGFKLAGNADFLRNPDDSRDWNVFEEGRRGATDRFALKFVKP